MITTKSINTGTKILFSALLAGVMFFVPVLAEASRLYHAAPKAAAKSILKKGIDPLKFRKGGRFNEMWYASKRPSTAIAEKGKRSVVLRFKTHKNLEQNAIDLRNPTAPKLRFLLGEKLSLRGKIKNKIIGPKLGHKLGQIAKKKDKVILFRSVKTRETNLAMSGRTLKKHPLIARPEKIVQQSFK